MDQDIVKGLRDDGKTFDSYKYVVEKMKSMVCETHTSPSQLVSMLWSRAQEIERSFKESKG